VKSAHDPLTKRIRDFSPAIHGGYLESSASTSVRFDARLNVGVWRGLVSPDTESSPHLIHSSVTNMAHIVLAIMGS
jgi:hypothetical protein